MVSVSNGPDGIGINNDGWSRTQNTVPTKTYIVSYTVDPMGPLNPEQIRYELSHQLLHKCIEENVLEYIEFEKIPGVDLRCDTYTAQLTCAEKNINYVTQEQNQFMAFDQTWSNRDIREALKNTYPERIL